jgi:hypothetical protein
LTEQLDPDKIASDFPSGDHSGDPAPGKSLTKLVRLLPSCLTILNNSAK